MISAVKVVGEWSPFRGASSIVSLVLCRLLDYIFSAHELLRRILLTRIGDDARPGLQTQIVSPRQIQHGIGDRERQKDQDAWDVT